MEIQKLMRLAQRLEPLFKLDVDSKPQEYYDFFIQNLFQKQRDYFLMLKAPNCVNLIILVYSLKKTKDFNLAVDILDKMRFCAFVVTENNASHEECYDCDGRGYTDCDNCDGEGRVECSDCDGDGTVSCNNCDGDGKIFCDTCDGSGEDEEGNQCDECGGAASIDCDNCGGEGTEKCSECEGKGTTYCSYCDDGQFECNSCDGSGEVDSDTKVDFKSFQVICWNKTVNDSCEININTMNPIIDESDFYAIEEKIILDSDDHQLEPEFSLGDDELYCYIYDTEPNLNISHFGRISIYNNEDFDEYFT